MVTETIKSSSDPLYVKTINKWSILDAFTTPSTPLQFIGSFALRARTSPEGQYIYYAVGDSKSRSSLFFHLPVNNPRRTNSNLMGNTYQLYLWVTPRK